MAKQSSETTKPSTDTNHWFGPVFVLVAVIGLLWLVFSVGSKLYTEGRTIREEERQERITARLLSQAWYCQIDDEATHIRRVEITHNTPERLALKVINPLTVTEMTYLYREGSGIWSKSHSRHGESGTFTIEEHDGSGRRFLATSESSGGTLQFAVGTDSNDCLFILNKQGL